MESGILYSIALSVLPAGFLKDIWDMVPASEHGDLYEAAVSRFGSAVQDHIKAVYGSDPLKAAEKILGSCDRLGVKTVVCGMEEYPSLLKEIKNPPVVLYFTGSLNLKNAVSVVGTRSSDPVSVDVAYRIASELGTAGCPVVSGMAAGIDRAAHLGALDSGGATFGVLANGIDMLYPAKNADIFRRIYESGASSLISEYPPGVTAGKWTFIKRNRIISGVSASTVVVKAARKSGAMITAGYAIEQNRELFVCPGHAYDSSYEGCHHLIREGASLLSSAEQILEEMSMSSDLPSPQLKLFSDAPPESAETVPAVDPRPAGAQVEPLSPSEESILSALGPGGIDVDALIRATGISAPLVLESLVTLELSGLILKRGNIISKRSLP